MSCESVPTPTGSTGLTRHLGRLRRARTLIAAAVLLGLSAALLPTLGGPAGADEVIDKVQQAQQIADRLDQLNWTLATLSGSQEITRHRLQEATAAADAAQAR